VIKLRILKSIIKASIMIIIIGLVYFYRNDISKFIINKFFYEEQVITYNSYYNKNSYSYVSNTDELKAEEYQDLLNIFYTILNSGVGNYTFECSSKYKSCTDDVKKISNDKDILSTINNYVHPFNSYQSISINISSYGNVTVNVNFIYNDSQIEYINSYLKEFIKNNVTDDMSTKDKIKIFHDYIINNTVYDSETIEDDGTINTKNMSHTAYGLLKNHKAICGGYTDIMAIYLHMLNINNYRISTDEHVWNLVYIDDKWLHLDLTFNDPIASDGKQYLLEDYFLIDSTTLTSKNNPEHQYNSEFYKETITQ